MLETHAKFAQTLTWHFFMFAESKLQVDSIYRIMNLK